MKNTVANLCVARQSGASIKVSDVFRTVGKFILPDLALVGLFAQSAQAQFVHFKSGQLRVTVSVNSSNSTVVTNLVLLNGINGSGASLSVTGLPTGATATLSVNPALTNNTPLLITVNTTNVAEGVYTFSLNGSATDTNSNPQSGNLLFTLQVGYLWNGGTNAVNLGAANLSDGTQYIGGVAPSSADDIIFTDLGGQSTAVTNINITSSMTNGSVRFATTNATKFYGFQLSPGVTWSLTDANGFSLLRDYIDNFQGISQGMTESFYGTGGATLAVENEQANFSMLVDNSIAHLVDLSGLDNFSADVSQFNLGDYRGYPNFFNIDANNTSASGTPGGIPRIFLASINFARTNVIKAIFADPFNYTNSDSRRYSLTFLNSELTGTSTKPNISLGISNIFLMDSVDFIGGNHQGTLSFNANMHFVTNIVGSVTNITTNAMSAVFRSTNGGRMSLFAISDGGGTNTATSNLKATIDFSSSGGTLDVLSDRFYIGRDRKLIATNQGPNYQGFLVMGNGIVDVNTATLGFREHLITNTTPPTFPTLPAFNGYCEGKVTIVSNGTFRVNNLLTLGSTVETLSQGLGGSGNTEYGQVILENGASLLANQINVGGPVYGASANNFITVSNGCTLGITNTIAGPSQSLDTLTFVNSTLVMTVDGANPGPYIYVTNLTTTGTNTIRIAHVAHLSAVSGPIQLIAFSAGAGSFQNLIMPSGVGGALLTTNNVGIYLTILTNTPKNIVWRGYNSADWDLSTPNFLDMATGLHTNFASGDFVFFDDDGSTPTTVHLAGAIDIIPGSVTMSNNANYYIIDSASGGTIKGSAAMIKSGTNGLEVDGTTTLAIALNQGYLVGSGPGASIGSASIAAGAVMNYGGAIGNGISCSGVATIASTGTGTGTIVVQAGGVVTNAGNFIGSFSMVSNAFLFNSGVIGSSTTAAWQAVGNPVVAQGATFVNAGDIHTETLTVNGTFEDKGTGTLFVNGDILVGTRGITIAAGGTFIPGGDSIGTTTINEDSSPNNFPGRLLFATGSTNIFKVNPTSVQNTEILTIYMGWGPNQSAPAVNGGTIVMSNVNAGAYSAGQIYTLVQNSIVAGDAFNASTNTTNSYPFVVPASPGPGLAWDLSGIIIHGKLGVIGVNTNSTGLTLLTSYAVIINTNAPGSTNSAIITEFKWPSDRIGWELQSQTDQLTNALGTNAWVTVAGSTFTNDVLITNIIGTNTTSAIFYRMAYP